MFMSGTVGGRKCDMFNPVCCELTSSKDGVLLSGTLLRDRRLHPHLQIPWSRSVIHKVSSGCKCHPPSNLPNNIKLVKTFLSQHFPMSPA